MQQCECPELSAGIQYPAFGYWFSTVKLLVQQGEAAAAGGHGPYI
jgi:hypothetical protein